MDVPIGRDDANPSKHGHWIGVEDGNDSVPRFDVAFLFSRLVRAPTPEVDHIGLGVCVGVDAEPAA